VGSARNSSITQFAALTALHRIWRITLLTAFVGMMPRQLRVNSVASFSSGNLSIDALIHKSKPLIPGLWTIVAGQPIYLILVTIVVVMPLSTPA
jgi:hypothetical protein